MQRQQPSFDLSTLLNRRFDVAPEGVPRILSDLQQERKESKNRIRYIRQLKRYDRPSKTLPRKP